MAMEKVNRFNILNEINVNEHVEQKNRLTYLSWAWAWQMFKQQFPESYYTIYENEHGWNYFTDGRTCWVSVRPERNSGSLRCGSHSRAVYIALADWILAATFTACSCV